MEKSVYHDHFAVPNTADDDVYSDSDGRDLSWVRS